MTQPSVPQTIGRYQVLSVLGEGAMGVVYAAFDPGIKRKLAIKTLHRHLLNRGQQQLLSRFLVEAEAAGRLSHPNIVAVYELNTDADPVFIAMEFVEGCTLAEKIKAAGKIAYQEIIPIVVQLLDALEYSHKAEVIHRDVKPANIMITPDHRVKVADFGMAHLDTSALTTYGDIIGTPQFMSPEQWMGKPVDHRTDIYATGVILYQALTGRVPFNADSLWALRDKVLKDTAVPPSQNLPTPVQQLDTIIAKALAKNPAERFQTAAEFRSALQQIRAPNALDDYDRTQVHRPQKKPQPKSGRRSLLVAGALTGLATISALGFYFGRGHAEDSGRIHIASNPPGASVMSEEDKILCTTPTTVSLSPGAHTVRLRKDGFATLEASIEVEAGKEIPINLNLNKIAR
jgi:serine/threonine-protein kinase